MELRLKHLVQNIQTQMLTVGLKYLFHFFLPELQMCRNWALKLWYKFKNSAVVMLLMQHLMPMLPWLVDALGEGCGN